MNRIALALALALALPWMASAQESDPFQKLVAVCAGEDMFAKERAVADFVAMGPAVVPKLIELLKHENRDARACAIDSLGRLGGPEATAALVGVVQTLGPEPKYAETFADTYLRSIAIQALGETKDPSATAALKAVVAGKDEGDAAYDRAFAFIALAKLGDSGAIPRVITQTTHENPDIRNIAVQGLGELKAAEGFDALAKALKDEKWFVRDSAAVALGKLGKPEAKPLLETAVKDDTSPFVRRSAAEALKNL